MFSQYRWRTVDLVVISVLGAAFGVVYWAWNQIWFMTTPLFVVFPPAQALLYGVWMLPQVIAMLIIRRPGAALFGSLAAVVVSTLLGNAFGLTMLLYGVAQGLAVELVFAVRGYRSFGRLLAGFGTAFACVAGTSLDTFFYYQFWVTQWKLAYVLCGALGGFLLGMLVAPMVVGRLRQAEVLGDFTGATQARIAAGLDPAELHIRPGERVLIAGLSGSGKSTLLRAFLANSVGTNASLTKPDLVKPDAVGIAATSDQLSGGPVAPVGSDHPQSDFGNRVALMQQDPESNILLARIGDDVAFGLENECLGRSAIWSGVDRALDQVGLTYSVQRPAMQLSGGEKQRLGLAGSIAPEPNLVLLDEPTANLDPVGVKAAIEAVDRYLTRTGSTLIVVDHNLELVRGIVDRLVVLRDSQVILDGAIDTLLADHKAELEAAGLFVVKNASIVADSAVEVSPIMQRANRSDVVLSARGLTVERGEPPQRVLAGVDLDIHRGEMVAICGANGAGKSTLARALGGLLKPTTGEVMLATETSPLHRLPARVLAQNIVSVFQVPEHQFLADSVSAELLVGLPKDSTTKQHAHEVLELLRLDQLAYANPFAISGGEQRRLALASAFMRNPKVLILDEPTFGQDAFTWQAITDEVVRLRDSGVAVVAVTHDDRFVEAASARVVELEKPVAESAEQIKRRVL